MTTATCSLTGDVDLSSVQGHACPHTDVPGSCSEAASHRDCAIRQSLPLGRRRPRKPSEGRGRPSRCVRAPAGPEQRTGASPGKATGRKLGRWGERGPSSCSPGRAPDPLPPDAATLPAPGETSSARFAGFQLKPMHPGPRRDPRGESGQQPPKVPWSAAEAVLKGECWPARKGVRARGRVSLHCSRQGAQTRGSRYPRNGEPELRLHPRTAVRLRMPVPLPQPRLRNRAPMVQTLLGWGAGPQTQSRWRAGRGLRAALAEDRHCELRSYQSFWL